MNVYFEDSFGNPWYLDSEVSCLHFVYSYASVSTLSFPTWANFPVSSLAEWVVGNDGVFIFLDLIDIPLQVRTLLSLDGLPFVEFEDEDEL